MKKNFCCIVLGFVVFLPLILTCRPAPSFVPVEDDSDLLLYLPFNGSIKNEVDGSKGVAYRQIDYQLDSISKLRFTASRIGTPAQALYFDGKTFLAFPYQNYSFQATTLRSITMAAWMRIGGYNSTSITYNICSIGARNYSFDISSLYIFDLNRFLRAVYARQVYRKKTDDWFTFVEMGPHDFTSLTDVFVHLCVTIDGDEFKLYVNGVEQASKNTKDQYDYDKNKPYTIDDPVIKVGEEFIGALDEVRIYSRALDANEVKRLTEVY